VNLDTHTNVSISVFAAFHMLSNYQRLLIVTGKVGVPSGESRIFFRGRVQQIQLRTEGRENGVWGR
jgi:hypothetical protein